MSGKLTVTLISERKRRNEHLGNLLFLLLGYIREFRRCKASDWEEDELDGRHETKNLAPSLIVETYRADHRLASGTKN